MERQAWARSAGPRAVGISAIGILLRIPHQCDAERFPPTGSDFFVPREGPLHIRNGMRDTETGGCIPLCLGTQFMWNSKAPCVRSLSHGVPPRRQGLETRSQPWSDVVSLHFSSFFLIPCLFALWSHRDIRFRPLALIDTDLIRLPSDN